MVDKTNREGRTEANTNTRGLSVSWADFAFQPMKILVTGAGGFIGSHLVKKLKSEGHYVMGADIKFPEYEKSPADQFFINDLRRQGGCNYVFTMGSPDIVYALAADMGGMGFIQDPKNQGQILYNNAMINLNTLEYARQRGVKKILFASSACVYPNFKQQDLEVKLKETDAYPADPQDTYGWEKLMTEKLYQSYRDSYGMDIRIVRFHNIYGPEGTYKGGREKAPAAMTRKVLEAVRDNKNYIEIWGDGKQTRSFCYIDDCLKALELVMNGDYKDPVNVGRDDSISINELARIAMKNAGVELKLKHVKGFEGVRGRNSDNTLFKKLYGWEPDTPMEVGMQRVYEWMKTQPL